MPEYYLGIDNGGTICKAVIFDSQGKQIAGAAQTLKLATPQAGFTERDMEELWVANCEIIRLALQKAGINAKQIKGIACTGHGKGLYLWGKDNRPCYPGIVSTDTRAWEYPKKFAEQGILQAVFNKIYQEILACHPVSLLCWLKDNEPQVIPRIKWIFAVKDYIRFRLTGEAYAEVTDYSGSALLNIKDRCFDPHLLETYGLGELFPALPPLRGSTSICGRITKEASALTGLVQGTPVAGGMFDIDASAIALGLTSEENIAVIGGTWSINEYISREPVLDGSVKMNSLYCLDDYYLIEESSPTSAGNLAWFVDLFLEAEKHKAAQAGLNVYAYCDKLAQAVSPEEEPNLIFLPFLYGSNYNPQATASLTGLASHHTKGHVIRAILEGIAFTHLVHLEKLLANREDTKVIKLGGGVAKSQFWAQIFADIFQLPIEIIAAEELGALGSAMAATVAAGQYQTLQDAAEQMVEIKGTLQPNEKNGEIYKQKYERYKKMSGLLEETWT